MKWKIEKYGAEMVKSWGYDIAPYVQSSHSYHGKPNFWQEVHQLRHAGKYKEAWELTKKHKTPQMWEHKFNGKDGETWRKGISLKIN